MIAYLRGTIITQGADHLVLDVNGVGYLVNTPPGTIGRLKPDDDGQVSIHIHTSVREDAIQLYGFAHDEDRFVFNKLIGISGVGPKLAQAILGEMEPPEILHAVETNDVARFTQVSGIGKKTASRLILELKSSVGAWSLEAISPSTGGGGVPVLEDLRSALNNLGYKQAEVDGVVDGLRGQVEEGVGVEVLLRKALKLLRQPA